MEARIKLSRETRQRLANPVLDKEQKKLLRQQKTLEYIDSQPAGKPLKNTDVIAAAGFDTRNPNDYASGNYFIQQMIKQGIIEREAQPRKQTAHYKVVKTTLEANKRVQAYTLKSLEEEAKEFIWLTGNDSLREFINFKKGEKNE